MYFTNFLLNTSHPYIKFMHDKNTSFRMKSRQQKNGIKNIEVKTLSEDYLEITLSKIQSYSSPSIRAVIGVSDFCELINREYISL